MHRPRSQLRSIKESLSLSLSPSTSYRVPRVTFSSLALPLPSWASLKRECVYLSTWIGKCLPTRVTYRHIRAGLLPSRFIARHRCLSPQGRFLFTACSPLPAHVQYTLLYGPRYLPASERAARNRYVCACNYPWEIYYLKERCVCARAR